jgi:hypothetical protein
MYFCKLALPSSTSNSQHTTDSAYGAAGRNAFLCTTMSNLCTKMSNLCTKMSKVNDKCRRSTRIAASPGAEPTRGAEDPPGPRLTPRNHKRTNITDNGPPPDHADPNSYAIATPSSRTKCFRISGIPQDWKEDDLLGALQNIDPDLRNQESQLSLYPACCGSSQTALLELDTTKYFESLGPNESYTRISQPSKTEAARVLTIDSDFYGLTPLNTPDKQIIAELAPRYLPKSNEEANTWLIAV